MDLSTRSIGIPSIPEAPFVLLVDDEEQTVRPLGALIHFAGFPTVATSSATEAIACCYHRRPAVVVTDLVMPGIDGRALAQRVRRRHPGTPIVLVTGQNLNNPDWAVPSGLFVEVFAKPLDLDRFLVKLDGLMNREDGAGRGGVRLDRPRRPR